MKKILDVVSYSYLPFSSGGQKLVAQFFGFLGKETKLTVLSTCSNDYKLVKNYKLLPWLGKSFFRYIDIRLTWKIASLIKKERFEVIIWEHPYYAWLAWIIKKRTGIKTIFHTHNIEHQRFRSLGKWWWPILKVYEKWSFQFSDFIFFITGEDRKFAIEKWNINSNKTMEVTFGVENKETSKDRAIYRQMITEKYQLADSEMILLFNGVLSYGPNLDALLAILNDINPHLLATKEFRYKIIICGKGLPEHLNDLREYATKNIIYAGFVDDIEAYFKGSDLFLNPVQSGGGIKTKMVEAIGFGTTVISTETGATGMNRAVCENKLVLVQDNEWRQFADAIINNKDYECPTPASFYHHYYWGNIVKKVLTVI